MVASNSCLDYRGFSHALSVCSVRVPRSAEWSKAFRGAVHGIQDLPQSWISLRRDLLFLVLNGLSLVRCSHRDTWWWVLVVFKSDVSLRNKVIDSPLNTGDASAAQGWGGLNSLVYHWRAQMVCLDVNWLILLCELPVHFLFPFFSTGLSFSYWCVPELFGY